MYSWKWTSEQCWFQKYGKGLKVTEYTGVMQNTSLTPDKLNSLIYTLCLNKAHYNFDADKPVLIIFGS